MPSKSPFLGNREFLEETCNGLNLFRAVLSPTIQYYAQIFLLNIVTYTFVSITNDVRVEVPDLRADAY